MKRLFDIDKRLSKEVQLHDDLVKELDDLQDMNSATEIKRSPYYIKLMQVGDALRLLVSKIDPTTYSIVFFPNNVDANLVDTNVICLNRENIYV